MDAFDLEVFGRVGDDYEAIHTIRADLERDLSRPVPDSEVEASLIRLVRLGFVDAYQFRPGANSFVAVDLSGANVKELWFMTSARGRSEYERLESFVPFIALSLGVPAGMMAISLIGRWVLAIYTTVRKYRTYSPGTVARRQLVWALPFAVLLHSAPWALAIAGYLSYYALSRPHGSWLLWFFGGVASSPIFLAGLLMRVSRVRKRIADERAKGGNAA